MSFDLNAVWKSKAINQWRLFWLITGPISIAMLIAMLRTDLSSAAGVSSMIQLSVRCAIPLLYLAFAASSIRTLFAGPTSLWLLRNRKIFGLCFAASMSWQAMFILWLVTAHRDYYVQNVFVFRDVIEGVLAYAFLIAMTLTSFPFGRRQLTPTQWRYLHKIGIYSLWIYAFTVYWWNLFYYPDPVAIDYVYYWGGFFAWAVRPAAWWKKRRQRSDRGDPRSGVRPALVLTGIGAMGLGLCVVAFGAPWQGAFKELTSAFAFSKWLELYLPYWPFEPFVPLLIILIGVVVAVQPSLGKSDS